MRGEVLVVAGLLVSGCAGSPGEMGSEALMREGKVAATVEVELQEEARFLLHVTSTADAPLDFTFPTSQRYDFVVYDGAGAEVWRWSDGMAFLQAISHARLEPGETWEFEVTWDPESRTGRYDVEGMLTASGHDIRQRTAFELP